MNVSDAHSCVHRSHKSNARNATCVEIVLACASILYATNGFLPLGHGQAISSDKLLSDFQQFTSSLSDVRYRSRLSFTTYDDANRRHWDDGSSQLDLWRKGQSLKVEDLSVRYEIDATGNKVAESQFTESHFTGTELIGVQSTAMGAARRQVTFVGYSRNDHSLALGLMEVVFGRLGGRSILDEWSKSKVVVVDMPKSNVESHCVEWTQALPAARVTTRLEFIAIKGTIVPAKAIQQIDNVNTPTTALNPKAIDRERRRYVRFPSLPQTSLRAETQFLDYSEVQSHFFPGRIRQTTMRNYIGGVARRTVADARNSDVQFAWSGDPSAIFRIKTPIPDKTQVMDYDHPGASLTWDAGKVVTPVGMDELKTIRDALFLKPPKAITTMRLLGSAAIILITIVLAAAWKYRHSARWK